MKNKGFTLVELLAVIILLSIIALIVVPKVLEQKENQDKKIKESQKELIYASSNIYIKDNNEDDIEPGKVFCITVQSLIDEGYINIDVDHYKEDIVKVFVDDNNNLIASIDNKCTIVNSNN